MRRVKETKSSYRIRKHREDRDFIPGIPSRKLVRTSRLIKLLVAFGIAHETSRENGWENDKGQRGRAEAAPVTVEKGRYWNSRFSSTRSKSRGEDSNKGTTERASEARLPSVISLSSLGKEKKNKPKRRNENDEELSHLTTVIRTKISRLCRAAYHKDFNGLLSYPRAFSISFPLRRNSGY